MALLRGHRRDDARTTGRRYRMRQRLISIGDDYWIEDEDGGHAFRVNGTARRRRSRWGGADPAGAAGPRIQERKLSVRDKMEIERDGRPDVTVKKAMIGFRDRFSIDVDGGPDLDAKGNIVDHEYEIEQDGRTVAVVSKRWFAVRDTYGVEIAPGEDDALVLAIAVCIDEMSHPGD